MDGTLQNTEQKANHAAELCGGFFLAGLLFVILGAWLNHGIRNCARWPTVDAVLTDFHIAGVSDQLVLHIHTTRVRRVENLVFRYSYSVMGTNYHSSRYYWPVGRPADQDLWSRFREGCHFTARYKPSDPSVTVVDPGKPHTAAFWAVVSFTVLAGVGSWWFASRR